MYIAVLDEVPDHMVPVLVAHATLTHHLLSVGPNRFTEYYDSLYSPWLEGSYRKCVLRVNQKEFNKLGSVPYVSTSYENSTLEGKPSCRVVVVGDEVPNVLKFAKLWKPNATV